MITSRRAAAGLCCLHCMVSLLRRMKDTWSWLGRPLREEEPRCPRLDGRSTGIVQQLVRRAQAESYWPACLHCVRGSEVADVRRGSAFPLQMVSTETMFHVKHRFRGDH